MVTVRDVQRRDSRERLDDGAGLIEPGPPHRVLHAVRRREVVERFACCGLSCERVDSRQRSIREEDHAGLRSERHHVLCPIVFLVAPRALVLLDDVGVVLIQRKTAGDPGLLVSPHPQSIAIERRRVIEHERSPLAQAGEVLTCLFIDPGSVRIRVRRQIDLRAGHV